MASVPLDPDLVEAMGLPPEPSDRQVAEILARAADAPAPSGEDEVAIWMRFAVAMQEQLIERPQKMMDTAEAGHYPVSSFHNMLSEEERGRWVAVRHAVNTQAMWSFITQGVAPRLVEAGYFRLI